MANPTPIGPNRPFRALLAASAVSNLGDGIRLAALPVLAATLTDSTRLVAWVTAAQFLPWLLIGPIGGVIVDRANRRRLILTTQTWRAAVMVGLAAAILADRGSIWLVFAVAFIITAGEILVDPSVVALVPRLVGKDNLDRANGQISSVELVTNNLVGAPVGVGLFGLAPWLPFVIDGASYLGSTLGFRRLPKPTAVEPDGGGWELDPGGEPEDTKPMGDALRRIAAEIPQGVRWLLGHPMLRPWTAAVAVFNLGAAAAFSLLVLLVLRVHGGSSFSFGVTLTAAALAGVAGSLAAPRLADRYTRAPVLLVAAAVSAVALLGLAVAPSLTVVVAGWTVGAAASGVMLAIGRGYIQRYCPDNLIGRAGIASRTITRTAFVVGALAGGELAQARTIPTAFAAAGATQLVAMAPMALALRHDR